MTALASYLFASPLAGTYILCTSARSINSKPNPRPSVDQSLVFQSRSKKLHFSSRGWQFLLNAFVLYWADGSFFKLIALFFALCIHIAITALFTMKMPVLHLPIVTQTLTLTNCAANHTPEPSLGNYFWNHPDSHYKHAWRLDRTFALKPRVVLCSLQPSRADGWPWALPTGPRKGGDT